jgi:hypothetical protein
MCPYCFNERVISADSKQWIIHMTKHRQDIIINLVGLSPNCVLCNFGKFTDTPTALAHYKWGHNRSDILKWAFLRLLPIDISTIIGI